MLGILGKEQVKIEEPGGIGWIEVLCREARYSVSRTNREQTRSDKNLCGSKYGLHPWEDKKKLINI